MLAQLFQAIKEWQKEQIAVCPVCYKAEKEGDHARCKIRLFLDDFPKCPICSFGILPGERHEVCDRMFAKKFKNTSVCIYCAQPYINGQKHKKCEFELGRFVGKI